MTIPARARAMLKLRSIIGACHMYSDTDSLLRSVTEAPSSPRLITFLEKLGPCGWHFARFKKLLCWVDIVTDIKANTSAMYQHALAPAADGLLANPHVNARVIVAAITLALTKARSAQALTTDTGIVRTVTLTLASSDNFELTQLPTLISLRSTCFTVVLQISQGTNIVDTTDLAAVPVECVLFAIINRPESM